MAHGGGPAVDNCAELQVDSLASTLEPPRYSVRRLYTSASCVFTRRILWVQHESICFVGGPVSSAACEDRTATEYTRAKNFSQTNDRSVGIHVEGEVDRQIGCN